MALSPIVIKTSFYLPTAMNRQKNVANLAYIARKPETIREHDDLELEPERDTNLADAEKHLEYAATREGSHGIFDAENRTADLHVLKEELKASDSIVYRIIFSLREDEAQRIGHLDRKNFENTVKKAMPEIAEKIGVGEANFKWCAAFHEKQGHPHVHILAWEKCPARTVGKLSRQEMKGIRSVFVRTTYEKERERLYIQKNYLRDILRRGGKEAMLQAKKELAGSKTFTTGKRIGPQISWEQEKELAASLENVSAILPAQGRMALKYMPAEVRQEAREAADWILRQPGFRQSVEQYQQIQEELASHYQGDPEKIKKAGEKAYEDIRDRVAQDVIKSAAYLRGRRTASISVARTALRAAWNSIEKERMKAEAKCRTEEQKKSQQRTKHEIQREGEEEKER